MFCKVYLHISQAHVQYLLADRLASLMVEGLGWNENVLAKLWAILSSHIYSSKRYLFSLRYIVLQLALIMR